jgi:hypothetical protein
MTHTPSQSYKHWRYITDWTPVACHWVDATEPIRDECDSISSAPANLVIHFPNPDCEETNVFQLTINRGETFEHFEPNEIKQLCERVWDLFPNVTVEHVILD